MATTTCANVQAMQNNCFAAAAPAAPEHLSLFNSDARAVWWMPRKPTRLYLYDVIARVQTLSEPKPWWVLVPSGNWRIAWSYLLLLGSSVECMECVASICFCQAPYLGADLWLVQAMFALDMGLTFVSGRLGDAATLMLNPKDIARRYLRSTFVIDLVGLLPLELVPSFSCWPSDPSCYERSVLPDIINWQWLHLGRWMVRWRSHDSFRSITTTSNDGMMQTIKYSMLVLTLVHIAGCVFYSAAQTADPVFAPICDHRGLTRLSDAAIAMVVEKHEQYDPRSPIQYAHLQKDGSTKFWNDPVVFLYFYYVNSALSAMMGDGSVGKNTPTRLWGSVLMLSGHVLFGESRP